jgi:hypothetical protein
MELKNKVATDYTRKAEDARLAPYGRSATTEIKESRKAEEPGSGATGIRQADVKVGF